LYEKSEVKVRLELGASRALTAALALVYGGAAAIVLVVPMSWWLRFVLAAFVAFSFYRAVGRHGWRRSREAVIAFELEAEDDYCALLDRTGQWMTGRLINRWVHPLLTLLVVKVNGHRTSTSVVIPADATAAEPFRRLRVRLKWRTPAA
jgi:membrane-bound toxin of toxin-antitoxin system